MLSGHKKRLGKVRRSCFVLAWLCKSWVFQQGWKEVHMNQSHVQLLETEVNIQLYTSSSLFCFKRCILLCKSKRGKKSFLSKLISFDEITQRCLCLAQTLNGLILCISWDHGHRTAMNGLEMKGKGNGDPQKPNRRTWENTKWQFTTFWKYSANEGRAAEFQNCTKSW